MAIFVKLMETFYWYMYLKIYTTGEKHHFSLKIFSASGVWTPNPIAYAKVWNNIKEDPQMNLEFA